MTKPTRNLLDTMPSAFIDVAALCAAGQHIPPLRAGSRNTAINLRHRFYKFRIVMIQQDHPLARALPDLSLTLAQEPDGVWALHFNRLGLGDGASDGAQYEERNATVEALVTQPLDALPDAPDAPPDYTEDAIEEYLRGPLRGPSNPTKKT